jgi:hypothetical protein
MNPYDTKIDLELNTAEARQAVTDWREHARGSGRADCSWWVLVNPQPDKGEIVRWIVFIQVERRADAIVVLRSDTNPREDLRSLEQGRLLWADGIARGLVPVTIQIL